MNHVCPWALFQLRCFVKVQALLKDYGISVIMVLWKGMMVWLMRLFSAQIF